MHKLPLPRLVSSNSTNFCAQVKFTLRFKKLFCSKLNQAGQFLPLSIPGSHNLKGQCATFLRQKSIQSQINLKDLGKLNQFSILNICLRRKKAVKTTLNFTRPEAKPVAIQFRCLLTNRKRTLVTLNKWRCNVSMPQKENLQKILL